ncbi:diguanylate cyclase [Vibrio genomosp. F10]|uniref:Diguanylate cyclase n=2 Tax=Vibrio genomosp. F10 TaxID=723171 RepID=A0A1B9R3E7_9VIBR|nr:diguanylate cyclase [Vibrio genomosp. F10]OCH78698.1 diguanylate cyclase [Vibrio genomosp. F10]OEE36853.1 diguanylate cyclase [Vibrio genomosp. F10 str. ZF-129]OEE97724.1 diguanylate cyclase [Vibrio genomosp. F10 str. 9ZC157]OEF06817.1 diguanylate cyclase [Vibrio genomosp. F10 str. 9ZB36]
MKLKGRNRHYIFLVFILYVFTAIASIEWINRGQNNYLYSDLLTRAKEELSIVRAQLEAAILADIYETKSLSALITVNPEFDTKSWRALATNILREGKHIRLIGLAPDDVVRFVHPEKGNQQALNLDYKTVPAQWNSIKKAHDLQDVFIAGPVDLVQGGRAVIARIPIFTDPPFNKEYWGVSSIVIDLNSLFHSVGVESLSHKYQLAIQGLDSMGKYGEVFFGRSAYLDDAFGTATVRFPHGSWELVASFRENPLSHLPWYRANIARLIGYPITLLLTFSLFVIYRQYTMAHKRSLHDELTGLPNRRYFMYTLDNLFKDCAQTENSTFAVLNIDLDGFKMINDTYGHAAGDKVLVVCAERLKSVLRSSDLVARVGGDEFLVILSRISNPNDVDIVNIALHKALCQTPVIYGQHLINIRASIGHALYSDDYLDAEMLLKVTDERMYQQKRRQLGT